MMPNRFWLQSAVIGALKTRSIGYLMWLFGKMILVYAKAILRYMALNLLKQEKTSKGGIQAKRRQAGWNNDYLVKVIMG